MKVNKTSPVPLYYQLAESIREQIASGELKPGDKIPNERELCQLTGISRMTVRHALAYLTQQGMLVAQVGKGTFVAEPKVTFEAFHLLGFSEMMRSQGRTTTSQALEQALGRTNSNISAKLQLPEGAPVVKVVRLRMLDELPIVLESSIMPSVLCPGLETENLVENSLYVLLEQKYGLPLERAHQSLEATVANDYEARLLNVAPGTPMMLAEGVTYTTQNRPIEYFKAIFRGDLVRFEMQSYRQLAAHPVNLSAANWPGMMPVFRHSDSADEKNDQ